MVINISRVLFLDQQKEGSQHNDPKTRIDLLIHVAIRAHLIMPEIDRSMFSGEEINKHIDSLPFTIFGQNGSVDSLKVCLTIVGVND